LLLKMRGVLAWRQNQGALTGTRGGKRRPARGRPRGGRPGRPGRRRGERPASLPFPASCGALPFPGAEKSPGHAPGQRPPRPV